MSAVKLAGVLSTVSDVTFVCKQGSFAERLPKESNYNFNCETVKFISRTFSPVMLVRVRSILKTHKIKNVIYLGASELKTLYFAFLGYDLNVIVWHGTTKTSPKRDFFHRLVYSCVNHHVAISNHLLRNMKTIVPEGGGTDDRVIRASLNVLADDTGAAKSDGRDCIHITHVGRIAGGKGQVDAVLSCRGLYEKGISFRLNIIGENDGNKYARQLEKTVEKVPYKEFVSLTGFRDDIPEFLAKTDIFLFPSSGEGMPAAFIEALHYGVVCIAYDNTVFPEFSEMGFYIHRVHNNNIEALSAKLLDVAAHLDDEKIKSEPNVDLASKYFQVERELSEWIEILE